MFISNAVAKYHQCNYMNPLNNYVCGFCQFATDSADNLNSHLEALHCQEEVKSLIKRFWSDEIEEMEKKYGKDLSESASAKRVKLGDENMFEVIERVAVNTITLKNE
jgi:hypothetical protein